MHRYPWPEQLKERDTLKLRFVRGSRVSVLAAMNYTGFIGWDRRADAFTRQSFYEAFKRKILRKPNPWPMPNSIVIVDYAKIHICKELNQ